MKRKARQDAISAMLADFIVALPSAAEEFCLIVEAEPQDRPALLTELQEMETRADRQYLKLLRKVGGSFVTPFDREDIYRLLENLDDVIDELEQAGALLVAFDLSDLPDGFAKNARHLVAMSHETTQAVSVLKKPSKVEAHGIEFYLHEAAMDQGYRRMLADTLIPGADPIRAMQVKTLLDCVERAASDMDQFMRSLGAIAIKET